MSGLCEKCGHGLTKNGFCFSCHAKNMRSQQTHSVYSEKLCAECGGKLTVKGYCRGCAQRGVSVPSRGWKWDEQHRSAQAARMSGNTIRRGTVAEESTRRLIGSKILGKKRSEITKKRLQAAAQRRIEAGGGRWLSMEQYKRLRSLWGRETSIERKVKHLLLSWNVNFLYDEPVDGIGLVDFLMPSHRAIIECDGGYWHSLPKQVKRDITRDQEALARGYKVLRLPEDKIKNDWEYCLAKVYQLLSGG